MSVHNGMTPHACLEWHLLTWEIICIISTFNVIVEHICIMIANIDYSPPYIPWMISLFGFICHRKHLKLHIILSLQSVGTEGRIVGIIIIVTIVAHQIFYTRLLIREIHHAECISFFKQTCTLIHSQNAILRRWESKVGNRVKPIKLPSLYLIGHFCLFRISFVAQHIIIYLAVKVAIIVKRIRSHFSTHFWTHLTD